jgi:hypothetical protein
MLYQNLKAIGEELSEICVLFCKYIYIFIYIDVMNALRLKKCKGTHMLKETELQKFV